jgi:ribokinase
VPNEPEARALLPEERASGTTRTGLAELLAHTLAVPSVVVTHGEAGCSAYHSGTTRHYPAHDVAVVDATGGSDAFTAALALTISISASEPTAVDAALTAAAWAVSHEGGHESMPTAVDLGWR